MIEINDKTQLKIRNKHQLPSYYCLSHIKFDLEKLRQEVCQLEGHFTSVYESNKSFCSNNSALAESVYSHFEQVSLTECRYEDTVSSENRSQSLSDDPAGRGRQDLGKLSQYKVRMSGDVDPRLVERNYTKPTDLLKGTYIEKCLRQFKSTVTRVRLVKLKAGYLVPAHIDYDPSYAVRVLLPIETNKFCMNFLWRKGVHEPMHLPANGSPWFFNVGFSHGVGNYGPTDRITLMISLDGQEDLQNIGDFQWKPPTSSNQ